MISISLCFFMAHTVRADTDGGGDGLWSSAWRVLLEEEERR